MQIAAPPYAADGFRLVDQALAAGDLGAAYEAARRLHSKVVRMLAILAASTWGAAFHGTCL